MSATIIYLAIFTKHDTFGKIVQSIVDGIHLKNIKVNNVKSDESRTEETWTSLKADVGIPCHLSCLLHHLTCALVFTIIEALYVLLLLNKTLLQSSSTDIFLFLNRIKYRI